MESSWSTQPFTSHLHPSSTSTTFSTCHAELHFICIMPHLTSSSSVLNHTSFARGHSSIWSTLTLMNCITAVFYGHIHRTLCIFACFVSTRVVVLTLTARKTSYQEPRRRPATKTHWHWHRLNNLFQITPYIFILCMIFLCVCVARLFFLLYIYMLWRKKKKPPPKCCLRMKS